MKSKQKSHWGNNVPGQEGVLGLTPTPGTPNPGLGSVPPDGGPAVEPPHQLPESLLTSRLHHWGTPLQPHRVLWFMMPPFPRPVVHAGPELHVPAAALLLCVGSTFRASSHSRQDQRDLPDPGIEPEAPALQVDSLPLAAPGKHPHVIHKDQPQTF